MKLYRHNCSFFSSLNLSFWIILYILYYKRHRALSSEPLDSEDGITLERLFGIASQQGLLPEFFSPLWDSEFPLKKESFKRFVINWETWRYAFSIKVIRYNILAIWGIRNKECREPLVFILAKFPLMWWTFECFQKKEEEKKKNSLNFLAGKARNFAHIAQD